MNKLLSNRSASGRFDPESLGLIYGFVGVFCFSLTLPATAELDPTIVGLGRALIASVLAAIFLLANRHPLPSRDQLKSLVIVAAGIVLGFPLLSAWALHRMPAIHGAIVVGLLPLATAVVGALRMGERPSSAFWAASSIASLLVVAFALINGDGQAHVADWVLLIGIMAAALGYAEGGQLAREMGGASVICWALVISAPFLIFPVGLAVKQYGLTASPGAWAGFAYVSVFSMFLGFIAWYRGLAMGGIARVSQTQLLQPFLTIFASALLLDEKITIVTILFALAIVVCVAVGRKSTIGRAR